MERLAWGAAFAGLAMMMICLGIESAMHFEGPAMDGPFQVYNALRRIAAGQRGGVDFQFFHGIGLPYLHYVPFRLLGGTFGASELTRQIVSAVANPLLLLVFFRVFTRDWRLSVKLAAIVLALSIGLRLSSVVVAIDSLLGARSFIPALVPVIWILPMRRAWRTVATGAAMGAGFLVGTEQGLAMLGAFLVVNGVLLLRSADRREQVVSVVATVAVAVATIIAALLAIGGVAGLRGALEYNLKLVPMDQYWYFGSPPNPFIRGWSSLFIGRPPLMIGKPIIPIAIVLSALTFWIQIRRTWRAPTGDDGRRTAALAMLALYGLASCASILATFLEAYVHPALRIVLLIGALEAARVLGWDGRGAARFPRLRVTPALVALLAVAAMTVSVTGLVVTYLVSVPHILIDHLARGQGPALGDVWAHTLKRGQAVVERHRGPDGSPPLVWSTYAGLLEAKNGIFNPSFDYIIHALGPRNRARYLDGFRAARPPIVQTVLPSQSVYEYWIEVTAWDMYAELVRNYRVVSATPWSLLWERVPTPAPDPTPVWSAKIDPNVSAVTFSLPPSTRPDPIVVLLQVEVHYRVHNPYARLPIFGGLPRHLVRVTGAITRGQVPLNPHVTVTRFPVLASERARPTLTFETASLLPGAGVEVTEIRVTRLPIREGITPWVSNLARSMAAGVPVSGR